MIIGAVISLPLLVATFLLLQKSLSGPVKYTNSIGMEFVLIPPGHFKMGSPEREAGRQDNELLHEVIISKEYLLGIKEVTVAQYVKVMGRNPGNPQNRDPNAPVQGVNYLDATEFCETLGKQDGNKYTLPTEAQWEYAARAGTEGHLFGDSDDLEPIAWYRKNSNDVPHSVGTKRANAWGLYDMIGNSREWCFDGPRNYTVETVTNPVGPTDGPWRVVRGGSWSNVPQFCRSASRHYIATLHRIEDGGFRVVLIKRQ
jgi:formylglycine-generating enzyme required for sulfatase activity